MNAINKFCPRSGKPVSDDSLEQHKGYTISFCNLGYSSDFAKNPDSCPDDRRYFNILIKERFEK